MRTSRQIFCLFCSISTLLLMYMFHMNDGNVWVNREQRFKQANNQLTKKVINNTNFGYDFFHKLFQSNQKLSKLQTTTKPWYLKGGKSYPKPHAANLINSNLFPHQDPYSDRIINQLMYVPHNYETVRTSGRLKVVFFQQWTDDEQGRDVFLRQKCPVDTCEITSNYERAIDADLILYKQDIDPKFVKHPTNPKQVTLFYSLESPYNAKTHKYVKPINWTATYRRDSDIVISYGKWVYYDPNVKQMEQLRNYAANKANKVAWVVSNCWTPNERLEYVKRLQKYIQVDIYGRCGELVCFPDDRQRCFDFIAKEYKFYLAFENSNCRDYITEKFFENALRRNILPIVMGAPRVDYEIAAPHHSFIHVDDFSSPERLADYLHILDKDDGLYNSYFKWKGTGELINTYFWCRICAALHDEESLEKPRWHENITEWWVNDDLCTTETWRSFEAPKSSGINKAKILYFYFNILILVLFFINYFFK